MASCLNESVISDIAFDPDETWDFEISSPEKEKSFVGEPQHRLFFHYEEFPPMPRAFYEYETHNKSLDTIWDTEDLNNSIFIEY